VPGGQGRREATMAKKTAKKATKKATKKAAKPRVVKEYIIPRAKVGCRIDLGSGVYLVIPRAKDGCKVQVEED
jgi:hypothetical protein